MARYIDADILIEQVGSLEQLARKRVYDTPTNSPIYERYSTQYIERERMLCIIKANPTADVVPRAEVEKLREAYNYRLAKDIQTNADFVRYATAEVAREIFEEIEKYMMDSVDVTHTAYKTIGTSTFAILKKKYAEGQK